jgi:hypothetical protein
MNTLDTIRDEASDYLNRLKLHFKSPKTTLGTVILREPSMPNAITVTTDEKDLDAIIEALQRLKKDKKP